MFLLQLPTRTYQKTCSWGRSHEQTPHLVIYSFCHSTRQAFHFMPYNWGHSYPFTIKQLKTGFNTEKSCLQISIKCSTGVRCLREGKNGVVQRKEQWELSQTSHQKNCEGRYSGKILEMGWRNITKQNYH